MINDWLAAWEALHSVFAEGAYSNIAINEAVSHHRDCDSGFVRVMTKGVIRDSLKLDAIVNELAKKGVKGVKLRTLLIIKMGLYAIDRVGSVPDYAAVSEAVSLAKKTSRGSEGFVNAILRSYLRGRDSLILPGTCEVEYGFPTELANMIIEQYGDDAERIMEALNASPELYARVNLLKTDRESLLHELIQGGFEAEAVEGTDTAIRLSGSGLISDSAYREGRLSVQTLPSIMAVEAFRPEAGAEVLDMCAAPGGKSCAMAEMMGNTGEIVSCDIYEHRLQLIEAGAKRLGIDIINTRLLDGSKLNDDLCERFDYVLADVPCSGLGVISSKPELKLRTQVKDYPKLIDLQKQILANAYEYAKVGGKIMYSTCTINRNENERVIEEFIMGYKNAQIVEKRLILPYNNSVGFFFCIIEKCR